MEKFLNDVIQYLLPTKDIFLYIFLFFSSIIENLFPPVPGDTITAFGAFLVGIKRLNYFWVYLSTTLGSTIGFMLLFLLGKFFGRKFFDEKNYKHFSAEKIQKTENWIKKFGYWIIVSNRFFPGIRSVISLVSGISKLNTYLVLLYSLISASVWNFIWIETGYLLGNNWEIVKEKYSRLMWTYNITAAIIAAVIIILFIFFRLYKNKIKAKKTIQ
jgi:membrane protein DedA with SNARE-associated domain